MTTGSLSGARTIMAVMMTFNHDLNDPELAWLAFTQRARPFSTGQLTKPARPPFALRERDFLATCTGCGRCVKVCPNDVLMMNAGYPQIWLDFSFCEYCGRCHDVCPTTALSAKLPASGLTATISEACENRFSFCDNCRNSCHNDALTWVSGEKPIIDTQKCAGCGECLRACYIQAIQML